MFYALLAIIGFDLIFPYIYYQSVYVGAVGTLVYRIRSCDWDTPEQHLSGRVLFTVCIF